jgi:hypothetical protein
VSAARAAPAVLQAEVVTETAYGGRDRAWSDVATLWVLLTPSAPGAQTDGAASAPSPTDTATATARDLPAAAAGQRLVAADDPDPWRVLRVDRASPRPGRMTLRLDRLI